MTIIVSDTLDAPIANVWSLISDFGGLMRWHPGVTSCVPEGRGVESERLLTVGERVIRERLTVLDEANHSMEYQIIESPDPLTLGMRGTISLNARGASQTDIRWISGWPEVHPHAAGVNARLSAYYPQRIAHLKHALLTGS